MTEDEIKSMKKEVSKKKRMAMEFASQVHDLVEDRLLTDYPQLTELAEQTVAACKEWAESNEKYQAVNSA